MKLLQLFNELLKAPPGPPPRSGLKWNEETHRWIRPAEGASGPQQKPYDPSQAASGTGPPGFKPRVRNVSEEAAYENQEAGIPTYTDEGGVKSVASHYDDLTRKLGRFMPPPEHNYSAKKIVDSVYQNLVILRESAKPVYDQVKDSIKVVYGSRVAEAVDKKMRKR